MKEKTAHIRASRTLVPVGVTWRTDRRRLGGLPPFPGSRPRPSQAPASAALRRPRGSPRAPLSGREGGKCSGMSIPRGACGQESRILRLYFVLEFPKIFSFVVLVPCDSVVLLPPFTGEEARESKLVAQGAAGVNTELGNASRPSGPHCGALTSPLRTKEFRVKEMLT